MPGEDLIDAFELQRELIASKENAHGGGANVAQSAQNGRAHQWLRTFVGVDRPIAFTILARAWSSAAGLITVALIGRFLSPAEQGYYYTFGSLVAVQIVFELGFSFVILQMASHERAHLEIGPDYSIAGDAVAHARLASVIQKSVRWYSVAAILMGAVLMPLGFYFFSTHVQVGQLVSWRLPWCFTAVAATMTFQLDPLLSFFEGCGFVADVARLRLIQAVSGSLLAWAALLTGHGLFAPSMMVFGVALVALMWLFGRRRLLLGLLTHSPGAHRIRWNEEVWPFQWRIAVSWICGYFIFQLFNPVLFAFKGPVAAGQMGMSLSLAGALQTVAISWISTKSAPFGAMIARKEYVQLDRLFMRAIMQSVGVCIAGAIVIQVGSVYLEVTKFPLAHRILSPIPLAILLLSTIINVVIFGQAVYLRAHKQEKFLLSSLIGAMLMTISTFVLGRQYGATGMVAGYLFINLLFGLPYSTSIFLKYRREWHAA